ncbi:MAG TPA: hypothetical protein VL157_07775, partial [Gemmatimonadaceae bacterium]|nr:hypothetical protein [Gemmatimonadaceae bacterium]
MLLRDPLRDRETKPHALHARIACSSGVATIKPLEHVRQLFLSDADPGVLDREDGSVVDSRDGGAHLAILARELHGIVEQDHG